jgi:hypothetical protein
VLIPYEQYLKFTQFNEMSVLERMERALARMVELNARYTDEEVEADLATATHTIRERRRNP